MNILKIKNFKLILLISCKDNSTQGTIDTTKNHKILPYSPKENLKFTKDKEKEFSKINESKDFHYIIYVFVKYIIDNLFKENKKYCIKIDSYFFEILEKLKNFKEFSDILKKENICGSLVCMSCYGCTYMDHKCPLFLRLLYNLNILEPISIEKKESYAKGPFKISDEIKENDKISTKIRIDENNLPYDDYRLDEIHYFFEEYCKKYKFDEKGNITNENPEFFEKEENFQDTLNKIKDKK